jgi:predicted CXXCH cytochrome family protein
MVLVSALLSGCSTENKHKWLTRFFDGVPPLGGATNAPAPTLATQPATTNEVAATQPQPQTQQAKIFLHQPYAKRQCTECHESQYSQKMKGKAGEACFACHENFLKTAKVKH